LPYVKLFHNWTLACECNAQAKQGKTTALFLFFSSKDINQNRPKVTVLEMLGKSMALTKGKFSSTMAFSKNKNNRQKLFM